MDQVQALSTSFDSQDTVAVIIASDIDTALLDGNISEDSDAVSGYTNVQREAKAIDNDKDHSESGGSPPRQHTRDSLRQRRLLEAQDWVHAQYLEHGTGESLHYVYRFLAFLAVRELPGIGTGATIHNAITPRYLFELSANDQDRLHGLLFSLVRQIQRDGFRLIGGDGNPTTLGAFVATAFRRNRKWTDIAESKRATVFQQFESPDDDSDEYDDNGDLNGHPWLGVGTEARYADYAAAWPDPYRLNPEQIYLLRERTALTKIAERLRETFFDSDDPCVRAISEIAIYDNRKYTDILNESAIARRLQAGDFTQADPENPISCPWTRDKVRRYIAKVRAEVKQLYLDPNNRDRQIRYAKTAANKKLRRALLDETIGAETEGTA